MYRADSSTAVSSASSVMVTPWWSSYLILSPAGERSREKLRAWERRGEVDRGLCEQGREGVRDVER